MNQNWRQKQKDDLKEQIFRTALRLFRDHGYENTTVQQITEKAGVAKGTFFNHFPSKEQVLAQWYRQFTLDAIEEVRGAKSANAERTILALMDGLAVRASAERKLMEMKARNLSDLLLEEERTLDAELIAFCCEEIRRGKSRGEFDKDLDEENFATLIVTTLTGTGRTWILAGDEFDLQGALRSNIGFLLRASKTPQPKTRRRS